MSATVVVSVLALAACAPASPEDDSTSAALAPSSSSSPSIIKSAIGGKCLSDNDNNIDLWSCNGTDAQAWTFTKGTITAQGGKCLDIQGNVQANGTPVVLSACNGTTAQKWTVSGTHIESTNGYCLDVTGGADANGTPIQVMKCNTANQNQMWHVRSSLGDLSNLPPEVVDAHYTQRAFFDDFDDLSTIDTTNTRDLTNTNGGTFNWWVYNSTTGVSSAGDFAHVDVGPITAVSLSPEGAGLYGATRDNTNAPIGMSFKQSNGGGAYFEASIAMSQPNPGDGVPAFWLLPTAHMQLLGVPWAGQDDAKYEHYVEVDILEFPAWSVDHKYQYRSTMIDWWGTDTCDDGYACSANDPQWFGPDTGGQGFVDSTTANPVFHRFGMLWIPSVPSGTGYTTGSVVWFLDGKSMGHMDKWVNPISTTNLDPSSRGIKWKYAVLDQLPLSVVLGTSHGAFMYVDYVAVWQLPRTAK